MPLRWYDMDASGATAGMPVRFYRQGGEPSVSHSGRSKKEGERLSQWLLRVVPSVGSDGHHWVIAALL